MRDLPTDGRTDGHDLLKRFVGVSKNVMRCRNCRENGFINFYHCQKVNEESFFGVGKERERERERETGREGGGQAERQTGRQGDRQTDKINADGRIGV